MPVTRSQKAQQEYINTQGRSSPNPIHISIDESDRSPEWTKYNNEDVSEWEFDGIVYLKDTDGFIYDIFTGENIGYFDGENILDVEEDGVWVLQSTKIEIIPKEEVHKEYSETELLQIRIKQLELDLKSKNDDMDFHLKVLSNKDKCIQQDENIRTHLIEQLDAINSKYIKLIETHQKIKTECKPLKDAEQTVASVLENSGAFLEENQVAGGDSPVMTYSQISQELARKENVIRRKDAKATRLINIIREKNLELANVQNKMQEMTRYQWMVSSNMKTLSDENMAWKNYYACNTTGQIPNTTESTQQQSYSGYNIYGQGQPDMPMTGLEGQHDMPMTGLEGQNDIPMTELEGPYLNDTSNSTVPENYWDRKWNNPSH